MPRLDTIILGGLLVTVEMEIHPKDPDVGIFEPYVSDWSIIAVNGDYRHSKFCAVLEKKVRAKESDFETRLMEEYNEQA